MTHTGTTNTRNRNFYSATVTNDSFVLNSLILATRTLVVADGAVNSLAKQASWLWLKGTIVNRFWVLDLSTRPGTDRFRRCDVNRYAIEVRFTFDTEGFLGFLARHYLFLVKFILLVLQFALTT